MDVKKNEISAHDILRFLPLRHILRLSFRQLHTFQIKATVFRVFVPDLKSTQREKQRKYDHKFHYITCLNSIVKRPKMSRLFVMYL